MLSAVEGLRAAGIHGDLRPIHGVAAAARRRAVEASVGWPPLIGRLCAAPPPLDGNALMGLVSSMLGMGAIRQYGKNKGQG